MNGWVWRTFFKVMCRFCTNFIGNCTSKLGTAISVPSSFGLCVLLWIRTNLLLHQHSYSERLIWIWTLKAKLKATWCPMYLRKVTDDRSFIPKCGFFQRDMKYWHLYNTCAWQVWMNKWGHEQMKKRGMEGAIKMTACLWITNKDQCTYGHT